MDELFVGLVVFFLTMLVMWARSRLQALSTFKRMSIPGPKPSFFYGNTDEAWSQKKPWLAVDKWYKEHGRIFGCFPMGIRPTMVVGDPEMLKEILIKNFSNFRNRPALGPPRGEPGASSLTTLRGERWKRVRNVISPTFTSKKLRQMSDGMTSAASTFTALLQKQTEEKNSFDIYGMFQALTLDVIAQAAFALKVDSQTNPDDALLTVCRALFKSFFGPMMKALLLFPELGACFGALLRARSTATAKEFYVITHMKEVLSERQKNPGLKGNDMIQLMMDATDDIQVDLAKARVSVNMPSHDGPGAPEGTMRLSRTMTKLKSSKYLTENELIANCFVFLLAGYETTANALAFTTYLLAKHPEIQEKLHDVIVAAMDTAENVSFEDSAAKLPYLDAIIKESLRLFPPITGFVMRECGEECRVNGIVIPAGMAIHVPVWSLHHDPEFWPDPYTFNPERFMPENASKIQPMTFMAFGEGPRNCIGLSFALMEIRITLAMTLRKFRIKPPSGQYELDLESPFVTMNPKNGVIVELEERKLD
ncbi:hypothetical protein RvY_04952 [Ramazzottius varieornatus]|uniref:Cytochrome P450 n=1 Tax=Ramazzottius varieornatus TaxID=947166 RepID=A0A1D1UU02_RAMVA|nr:hypothetical protein RvY_04952 [Ramazzottius varieornatus]